MGNCHAAGIKTGADLKTWSLEDLSRRFGSHGSWYFGLARGFDDRQVNPNRERKSSGSETTFGQDLFDAERIEAGVLSQADEAWAWCEKTGSRARTVTVKIKWADFQQSTRSRSLVSMVDRRAKLHEMCLGLIRSVLPAPKGVRLVGVMVSNFVSGSNNVPKEASLLSEANSFD